MDALLDLHGQVIVLTGGAGALGVPIARTLLEHGARVAVVDLPPEDEVVSWPGPDPHLRYIQEDLTAPQGVSRVLEEVETVWGAPDSVCCHAGMVRSAPLPDHELSDFDDVMRLNVRASYAMARESARRWMALERGGNLVFTGSWVQDVPWPGIASYAASKAALRSIARSFARELAPHGIRSNVVAPGIVDAGMARHQWDTEPDYRRRASRAIPLGTLQPPESVAHAVLFACSRMSSYMTGATLLVDGGASLYPMDDND